MKTSQLCLGEINEWTNQCIVALSSGGVQCRSIPLKTIKKKLVSNLNFFHSVHLLHNNNMASNLNLDSRLGQMEEQGKTMVAATRRLLDTVYAV